MSSAAAATADAKSHRDETTSNGALTEGDGGMSVELTSRQNRVRPFGSHSGSSESCLRQFLILHKVQRDVEPVWSYPLPFEAVEAKYPMFTQFVYSNHSTSYCMEEFSHTFVLTDGHGIRMYGHCTAFVNGETVVCLSPYPWCRFFTRIAMLFRVNGYEIGKEIVKALCNSPTPPSGGTFLLPAEIPITLQRPYDRLCPFIDTYPISLLTIFPDTSILFSVLADLLLEKHIIVVGPNFGLVSHVVMSLQTLISPFDWIHILISVLPSSLLDVLAAPTPYLAGILTSQLPLLETLPIDSYVMIQLGPMDVCEGVYYHNEERHTLPNSGFLSALRMGFRMLKMRDPRDQTVRDLCSLFLTYYATLLGGIGTRDAESHMMSSGNEKDVLFYRSLMTSQSYNVLIETVQEALSKEDNAWMDNEFFVALVRGHAKMYPRQYEALIREENEGGGYAARYENCFGTRGEFTAISAVIHGFGGHRMSTCRLFCQCFRSVMNRALCLKNRDDMLVVEASDPSINHVEHVSVPIYSPVEVEMVERRLTNGTK